MALAECLRIRPRRGQARYLLTQQARPGPARLALLTPSPGRVSPADIIIKAEDELGRGSENAAQQSSQLRTGHTPEDEGGEASYSLRSGQGKTRANVGKEAYSQAKKNIDWPLERVFNWPN